MSLITYGNEEYIKSVTFIVCKKQAIVTSRHVLHAVSKMFNKKAKENVINRKLIVFDLEHGVYFTCGKALSRRKCLERSPRKRMVGCLHHSRDRLKS